MRKSIVLLCIALLAFVSTAEARPINIYLGLSAGEGVDLDDDDLDLDFDAFDLDNDDLSFKLFAGVSLGRTLGVEVALHNFGSLDCCDGVSDASLSADVDGISAALVAGFPVWRLRLFAKVGLLSWDVDGTLDSIAGDAPFKLDGEDPMAGVGADLKLTDHLSVRAELEVFKVADGSLNMASVGIQFKF